MSHQYGVYLYLEGSIFECNKYRDDSIEKVLEKAIVELRSEYCKSNNISESTLIGKVFEYIFYVVKDTVDIEAYKVRVISTPLLKIEYSSIEVDQDISQQIQSNEEPVEESQLVE